MNRAFSAGGFLALYEALGRCPRLLMNAAPLALKKDTPRRNQIILASLPSALEG
jgi:hypothetical protein